MQLLLQDPSLKYPLSLCTPSWLALVDPVGLSSSPPAPRTWSLSSPGQVRGPLLFVLPQVWDHACLLLRLSFSAVESDSGVGRDGGPFLLYICARTGMSHDPCSVFLGLR